VRQEEKKRRRTNLSDICNTYFDYEEDSAPRYSIPTNQMQGGGPAGYVSDQSDGEGGEGDGDLNYSDDDTGTGPLLPPLNEPRLHPSSGLEAEREGADRNESESGSNSNKGDQPRRLNTEFKVHSTLKKRCSVSWSSPHTDTHTAKEQSASRESVRKREKEMEMESIRDIDKEREREREKDPIPGAKGGRGYGSRGESKGEGEGKAVGFRFEGDSWDRSTFGELRRKYSEGHSQRERDKEKEKEKEKERTGHADRDGEKGEEKHSGRVTIETELSEVEIEVEVEAAGVCEEADSAPDSIPSPHRLSTLPSPPHIPLLYKPRRSVDTTSHRTSLGSQGSSSSNSSRHMRQFRKTSKGSLSFSRSPRHIPVIVPRQSLLSTSLPTSVPLSSAQGRNDGESSDSDSVSESGSDSDSDSDFNMVTSVPPVGAVLPPTLRPFHTTRTSLSHSKKRSSPSKVNRHSSFLPSFLYYTITLFLYYDVTYCTVLCCKVLIFSGSILSSSSRTLYILMPMISVMEQCCFTPSHCTLLHCPVLLSVPPLHFLCTVFLLLS
jgi:hypothetical protein